MKSTTLTRIAAVGSLLSMALTLYVLFGNHNWFGDRQALTLDPVAVAATAHGPALLERFGSLPLRCGVEQSRLGAQVCWSEIGSVNDLPARSIAFYFDARQQLTAWKLDADADHYAALQAHFRDRYGDGIREGALVRHEVAGGKLLLPAQAGAEGASVLWLRGPLAD